MEEIGSILAASGGMALLVDYGHLDPDFGDTLQAVRQHRFVDVLAEPGEADLTAHVDFQSLAAVARKHGLAATTMQQGNFLLKMGLLERAGRLGAPRDEEARKRLASEVERLASQDQMGCLFKVLMVHPANLRPPPSAGLD